MSENTPKVNNNDILKDFNFLDGLELLREYLRSQSTSYDRQVIYKRSINYTKSKTEIVLLLSKLVIFQDINKIMNKERETNQLTNPNDPIEICNRTHIYINGIGYKTSYIIKQILQVQKLLKLKHDARSLILIQCIRIISIADIL